MAAKKKAKKAADAAPKTDKAPKKASRTSRAKLDKPADQIALDKPADVKPASETALDTSASTTSDKPAATTSLDKPAVVKPVKPALPPVDLVFEISKNGAGAYEVVAKWDAEGTPTTLLIYTKATRTAANSAISPWTRRVAQTDKPLLRAGCGINRHVRSLVVVDNTGEVAGSDESKATPTPPTKPE
jgi:hypothetical protein